MDYDTVPKFAIVISVVAVIVAAAAIVMVATDDDGDDRYRIYVSMDADATPSQEEAVENHVKSLVTEQYRTGYTMYWADGAYVDGGSTVENRTLVIILLDVSAGDADAIVEDILEQDGVGSVAKETYSSEFVLS